MKISRMCSCQWSQSVIVSSTQYDVGGTVWCVCVGCWGFWMELVFCLFCGSLVCPSVRHNFQVGDISHFSIFMHLAPDGRQEMNE